MKTEEIIRIWEEKNPRQLAFTWSLIADDQKALAWGGETCPGTQSERQ